MKNNRVYRLFLILASFIFAIFIGSSLIVHADSTTLVDSGTVGTNGNCPWSLYSDGRMTVGAGTLTTNSLDFDSYSGSTLRNMDKVTSIDITGKIKVSGTVSNFAKVVPNLESITGLPNVDTSEVTSGKNAFKGLTKLQTIDLSSLNLSNVTNVSNIFSGDSSLMKVTLGNWDAKKVTDFSNMFSDDSSLEALDISGLSMSDGSTVTNMLDGLTKMYKLTLSGKNILYGSGLSDPTVGNLLFTGSSSKVISASWQSIKNGEFGTPMTSESLMKKYEINTENSPITYQWTTVPTSTSTPTPTPTPTPDKDFTYLKNYGSVKVGSAVYGTKHIYLYKDFIFSKNERLVSYVKKARIKRPMFIVNKIVKNKNGKVRFYVKDVNQHSSTKGKTGYITANKNYASIAYYQTQQAKVTVINPNGVTAYKKANLTGKVKTYKQGTILNVKKIVKHNLTTRYVLANGQYITANRKLVQTGKQKMVKLVQVKKNIKLYRDVNLSKRAKNKQVIKKGTKLSIKKYDYSQTNVMTKSGTKRYLVKGGYITANSKYVKTIQTK